MANWFYVNPSPELAKMQGAGFKAIGDAGNNLFTGLLGYERHKKGLKESDANILNTNARTAHTNSLTETNTINNQTLPERNQAELDSLRARTQNTRAGTGLTISQTQEQNIRNKALPQALAAQNAIADEAYRQQAIMNQIEQQVAQIGLGQTKDASRLARYENNITDEEVLTQMKRSGIDIKDLTPEQLSTMMASQRAQIARGLMNLEDSQGGNTLKSLQQEQAKNKELKLKLEELYKTMKTHRAYQNLNPDGINPIQW